MIKIYLIFIVRFDIFIMFEKQNETINQKHFKRKKINRKTIACN